MAIIEGMFEDAPEAFGWMFIQAVREKNVALMNNILRRPFLWGKYHQQLTKEEQQWCTEHTENPLPDDKDYD